MRTATVAGAALIALVGFTREAHAEDGGGMQSPFAFGLGLFLTGVGTAGLAVGGHLFTAGDDACEGLSPNAIPTLAQIDTCIEGTNQQVGGIVAMVTGGAFVIAGLPVMILGALPADRPESAKVIVHLQPTGGAFELKF
ncbi:MAG: hypothetical protein HOW73_38545 [Polyangiaceae bacterium]|nr:hypothetical protein [Polyangiaceae bacterium]